MKLSSFNIATFTASIPLVNTLTLCQHKDSSPFPCQFFGDGSKRLEKLLNERQDLESKDFSLYSSYFYAALPFILKTIIFSLIRHIRKCLIKVRIQSYGK